MAIEQLEYCTAETNVIASLADKPNAQSGMTAAQVKAKFDAADAAIKGYINDTLVPYVNNNLGAMDTKLGEHDEGIDALETDRHTHGNKELLDSYTQTEANLADAVSKKHEHTNKTKLDTYDKTQTELLQLGCNPNLLDNWYFPKPVNQRGSSSYSGTSWAYTIDRWSCYHTTYNVGAHSCTVNAETQSGQDYPIIQQRLEAPPEGVVTFSVLADGEVYTITKNGDSGSSVQTPFGGLAAWWSSDGTMTVRIFFSKLSVGESVVITAAKLEMGAQQTLCHKDANGAWVLNEVPNYGEQLARCQRYYFQQTTRWDECHKLGGAGICAYPVVPVQMRITPSATVTAQVYASGWKALSFVSIAYLSGGRYRLTFDGNVSGTTDGYSYLISLGFELSADL